MQKLGLCSAHISIWFGREEKYEIRPKYEEIQLTICLCSQNRRQNGQADPRRQRRWPPIFIQPCLQILINSFIGGDMLRSQHKCFCFCGILHFLHFYTTFLYLFQKSLTGFEALAKDVGSDGDLVGDPNLPLLLWSRCWRSFLNEKKVSSNLSSVFG